MSRLPLAVLLLALPAFAQEVDAGVAALPGLDEAEDLLQHGTAAEALERLDAVAKTAPDDPRVLTLRCRARAQQPGAAAAQVITDCDAATRAAPSDLKVRALLAKAQEDGRKLDDALDSYRMIQTAPEAPTDDVATARLAVERLDTLLHAGRHFTYLWDADVPALGTAQPQLWVNPHWGRVDPYTAVDLRAGVLQAFGRQVALGFFVDASPKAVGAEGTPSLDARGTLAWQHAARFFDRVLGFGDHVELSAGPVGLSLLGVLIVDAQLGPVRLGVNGDVGYDHHWTVDTSPNLRSQQSFGFMYGLNNGFSFGVEGLNRITWTSGTFEGMAFYFGPSLAYRGRKIWFTLALLPQVSARKSASNTTGDPLELTDNERYSLKLTLGTVAP